METFCISAQWGRAWVRTKRGETHVQQVKEYIIDWWFLNISMIRTSWNTCGKNYWILFQSLWVLFGRYVGRKRSVESSDNYECFIFNILKVLQGRWHKAIILWKYMEGFIFIVSFKCLRDLVYFLWDF